MKNSIKNPILDYLFIEKYIDDMHYYVFELKFEKPLKQTRNNEKIISSTVNKKVYSRFSALGFFTGLEELMEQNLMLLDREQIFNIFKHMRDTVKIKEFDLSDFDEVESAVAFFGTRNEKRWISLLEVEFKRHADFLYRKSGKIIIYSPQTSPGEARKEAIKSYTHLGVNEKGKLCHPLIDQRYKT
jgi:hypothetical protein